MIATEDLVDWVKAEVEDTVLLRRLEQAAVATFQTKTGRYVGPVAATTEVLRFKGWPLALSNEPIGGVITTLEHWDGSAWVAVDAASFYVVGRMVFGEGAYYPSRLSRFRVTYPAGYPPHESDPDVWFAPSDVQDKIRQIVALRYEYREGVGDSAGVDIEEIISSICRDYSRVAF